MIDTHGRLALTHLQVGQLNHPKRNLQKILDIREPLKTYLFKPARTDFWG